MSFSANVKAELCRDEIGQKCCALAMCYGVLLYCNTFTGREIKIMTENPDFAALLPRLFRRALSASFDTRCAGRESGGKHVLRITDGETIERICQSYGTGVREMVSHHINFGVLENDCCKRSFMKGAFLAGGSVTDPEKRYHLELVTDHFSVRGETAALLREMDFHPKQSSRGANYVTYFKQSDVISDFLAAIGAPVAAMGVLSAKIEKDVRNSVNRKVNCDTANVMKTVEASEQQTAAIESLRQRGRLETLPDKLRQTAEMRLEYPEMSLSELASLLDPPVTKSCLNHRLRKLVELSKE